MLFHELGHAAALARIGGAPGSIGFGLYLFMPTFFADVSQLWRFPRRQRMVVDLGGAYFQQIAFALFAVAAARSGRMELLAACRMIDVLVLVALNPIFRFDGYWFLADYLAMPKLHGTALRYPFWRLRRRLGLPVPPLPLPPFGRLARLVFVSYSLLASVFLVFAFWLSYRYLTQALTRFPAAASNAWTAAGAALAAGEPALFAARLLAAFFLVAVPATVLLAVALALASYLRRAWRWVAGAIAGRRAARRGARRPA
jgi:putative peptide zinc metalloprotease protein